MKIVVDLSEELRIVGTRSGIPIRVKREIERLLDGLTPDQIQARIREMNRIPESLRGIRSAPANPVTINPPRVCIKCDEDFHQDDLIMGADGADRCVECHDGYMAKNEVALENQQSLL